MHNWWVTTYYQLDPMLLYSWVFWVIISICLHELGHGFAALHEGDDTPRAMGHITLNPMVHMGPIALAMFALFGFTWGLMPVNPSNFRRRYSDTIVAAAGPAVNVALAVLCLVLAIVWMHTQKFAPGHVQDNVTTFLRVGLMINIVGVLFNLIPIPPLDGSRIAADLVPSYRNFVASEQGQFAAFVAFGLLFMFGGSRVWGGAFSLTDTLLRHGHQLTGAP